MRLLSILGDTPDANHKSLRETTIEKIQSGLPLTEAEAELVLTRLSESDPFSASSAKLLSDEDLQNLGLTRDGLEPASFNKSGDNRPTDDPFDLSDDNDQEQPGVSLGNEPGELGVGSEIPEQVIPETIIDMHSSMNPEGEIPGVPGYDHRSAASDPDQAALPNQAAPQEDGEPLETRPFPRRKPVGESTVRRSPEPALSTIQRTSEPLMEGLSGIKKLQRRNGNGQRSNASPEAVIASLGLSGE